MANNFTIPIHPLDFVIPSSGGPSRGVVQNRHYLAFDDSTQETCYSKGMYVPAEYTGSGTLKLDIFYMMSSATTNATYWEVQVEAVTPADATNLASGTSFDTVNSGNGTVPGTAGYLGLITVTLTNKDSMAAGDYLRISLARDADNASDTATGDARVLLCVLREQA